MISNYECLYGHKPYQHNNFTPNEFKIVLEDKKPGHKTLVDIFLDEQDILRDTLKQEQLLFSDHPLLKRNKDGLTLLRTFHLRQDHQMIKMLANILLQCPLAWAARDVVMSDIVEIFESEETLVSFK